MVANHARLYLGDKPLNVQHSAAIILGKLAGALSRRLGGGGGTALPGLVASAIDPHILPRLASQIAQGSLLVTGTNGKTTTARMVSAILRAGGLSPLQNRTGSNLLRGLTTALLERAGPNGLRGDSRAIGVFEVDEAVLPQASARVSPRAVAIMNLFRDQLDRYGEVDTVRALWQEAVASLTESTALVLNADDPAVAALGQAARGPVVFFGVDDVLIGQAGLEHAADSISCSWCGVAYQYQLSFYSHLGHFRCPSCGWVRPSPQVAASQVEFRGFDGTQLLLSTPQGQARVSLALGGLYNVYNALAAAALGLSLGLHLDLVKQALEGFTPAFGRMERVAVDGRHVHLILVKNPTGFNQVLATLSLGHEPHALLLALNDEIADGRDVSWIWDVDFERLKGPLPGLVVSGLRAEDMALRLKYAGLEVSPTMVEKDLARALDLALEATPPGGTLYVLPTYTAMLSLEHLMARRGWIQAYWERE